MNVVVPEPALLGELASLLQADTQGRVKAEYAGMFAAVNVTARRRLHEPLTPDEFEMNTALAEGTELCGEVISAVWNSMHP